MCTKPPHCTTKNEDCEARTERCVPLVYCTMPGVGTMLGAVLPSDFLEEQC